MIEVINPDSEEFNPRALQFLKQREEGLKNLIRLQLKLEVADEMASETAKSSDLSEMWRAVAISIQEVILKQKEYNELAREGDKTGSLSPEEMAIHAAKVSKTQRNIEAQRQKQKQYSEETNALIENKNLDDVSGGDKLKKVEQKINVVAKY